eukprot:gene25663-11328_t
MACAILSACQTARTPSGAPRRLQTMQTETAANAITDLKVKREDSAPGFERAKNDEDMEPLIRENLDPDFAYWKDKKLEIMDLVGMRDLMYYEYTGIVVIKNNVMHIFKNKTAFGYAITRMRHMQEHVMRAVRDNGVVLPDTIFFYNLVDFPPCQQIRGRDCTAPVFTVYKRWNYTTNSNSVDSEISIPHFGRTFGYLYNYPWNLKNPRAMLRARMQVSMGQNSTRLTIAELASTDPKAVDVLDAGIVANRNEKIKVSGDAQKKFVWLKNHARWKFLINTNGHVCSSRLGQLFQMNSLVISEPTDWVEYYYRSIHPNEHFVHLNMSGVVQQVKELQHPEKEEKRPGNQEKRPENEEKVLKIVSNSQHFGYRYLGHLSKTLYNALFSNMEEIISQIKIPAPLNRSRRYLPRPEFFLLQLLAPFSTLLQRPLRYLRQSLLRYNALFGNMEEFMSHLKIPAPSVDLALRKPTQPSKKPHTLGEILPEDDWISVEPIRPITTIQGAIFDALRDLGDGPYGGSQECRGKD